MADCVSGADAPCQKKLLLGPNNRTAFLIGCHTFCLHLIYFLSHTRRHKVYTKSLLPSAAQQLLNQNGEADFLSQKIYKVNPYIGHVFLHKDLHASTTSSPRLLHKRQCKVQKLFAKVRALQIGSTWAHWLFMTARPNHFLYIQAEILPTSGPVVIAQLHMQNAILLWAILVCQAG